MNEILSYIVLCGLLILAVFVVVTIIVLRKDKHFALAVVLVEIAAFIAVSTFSQNLAIKTAVTMSGLEANFSLNGDSVPPYSSAIVGIGVCTILAIVMMAMRTWHHIEIEKWKLRKEAIRRGEELESIQTLMENLV